MSSLSVVNQKEYLKKYLALGKAPGEKKRKKKKDKDSGSRLKIIDDDIDDYNMSKEIQLDIEAADEDAPQIVAVIDDRPPSLRVDEKSNTLLWKPLGEDDDVKPEIPKKMSSFQLKKPTVEKGNILSSRKMSKEFLKKKMERTHNPENHLNQDLEKDFKKEESSSSATKEKANYSIRGKSQSVSSKESSSSRKHDRGSPKSHRDSFGNDLSPPSKRHRDNDISPLKKDSPSRHIRDHSHLRDLSPLRTIKQEPIDDSDHSPPRRYSTHSSKERNPELYNSKKIKQEHSDNDFSPPRRKEYNSSAKNKTDMSPPRRSQTQRNDSKDITPPRRKQFNSSPKSNEDMSPPRRAQRHSNGSEDISPPRRKQKDSSNKKDRDISPARNRQEKSYREQDGDMSPARKKYTSDRNNQHSSPRQEHSRNRKDRYDSDRSQRDISPLRRKRVREQGDLTPPRRAKDLSPPRKRSRGNESISPPQKIKSERISSHDQSKRDNQTRSRWGDWSPDHNETKSSRKPEKTMSGKRSGLQSAKELSKEIATLKEKEDRVFQNMSEEVSGRTAITIVRGQKQKDPEEEAQKLKKEKEMKEKYDRWGKGLKQVENENQRMADQLYEMSKPLARYADDEDLEKYLKDQEREGDPMLNYIRKKKKKKRVDAGMPDKPMYMGEFMPNRYGIRPGYRWDGVDRSNEYEKKWFEKFNARKAVQEEAFKWSTEDM